jgi:hypothetical protein
MSAQCCYLFLLSAYARMMERATMIQDEFQTTSNQSLAQAEQLQQARAKKLEPQTQHRQDSSSGSGQPPDRHPSPGRRPLFRS